MEKSKKIYLIGLPGAGKSTLGKALADHFGYMFADLDLEMENAVGMTIPEYFTHQGEGNFRIMEKETLHSFASKHDGFVLATGGGTPCFHYNMDFMNESGLTIFLDVSAGDLALRILDQGVENRPLFKSYDHQDLIQEVRDLAEKRMEFYDQAQIKIRDNRITLDKIISYL
uniref:shikimate kinase n=1 Tax=Roseivirga sp. TaxID=1964215 RepID=UPI004047DB03